MNEKVVSILRTAQFATAGPWCTSESRARKTVTYHCGQLNSLPGTTYLDLGQNAFKQEDDLKGYAEMLAHAVASLP